MTLSWVYDDGGREAAGFQGHTGDCAARAVAIVTGRGYQEVYDDLAAFAAEHEAGRRARGKRTPSHPRTGYHSDTLRAYLAERGWRWVPTMEVGTGTRVHLSDDLYDEIAFLGEVRVIVRLSRHYAAVAEGTIRDTHDPSREGTRAVYGYWIAEADLAAGRGWPRRTWRDGDVRWSA